MFSFLVNWSLRNGAPFYLFIMNHKWDIITDKCLKCGIEKRTRQYYTKDGFRKMGYYTEYLVDNKWTNIKINCKIK